MKLRFTSSVQPWIKKRKEWEIQFPKKTLCRGNAIAPIPGQPNMYQPYQLCDYLYPTWFLDKFLRFLLFSFKSWEIGFNNTGSEIGHAHKVTCSQSGLMTVSSLPQLLTRTGNSWFYNGCTVLHCIFLWTQCKPIVHLRTSHFCQFLPMNIN